MINLIIILLLIGIPNSVFAVDKSVSIGENLHFSEKFVAPISYLENFAPGDSASYVMTIKEVGVWQWQKR